jgi:hypothetical protein
MQGWFDSLPVVEVEKFLVFFLNVLNSNFLHLYFNMFTSITATFSFCYRLIVTAKNFWYSQFNNQQWK